MRPTSPLPDAAAAPSGSVSVRNPLIGTVERASRSELGQNGCTSSSWEADNRYPPWPIHSLPYRETDPYINKLLTTFH